MTNEKVKLLELERASYQGDIVGHDSQDIFGNNQSDGESVGSYVKSMIFGGLDGMITCFSVISVAVGGDMSWETILLLGFGIVLASGFYIGAGEYLSSRAHRDFILAEKRREQWEYRNYKDGEIKEMISLFNQRGMSYEDADIVVRKMAQYEDFFINIMIREELGLPVPNETDLELIKDGIVMWLSYSFFGSIPLFPFCAGPYGVLSLSDMIVVSASVTVCCLFILGSVKSTFSSSGNWISCGFETLSLGTICAGIAYGVGCSLRDFLDEK